MQWQDLKQYDNNPPGKALSRKPHMDIAYGKFKSALKKNGETMCEYVLRKLFDIDEKFIITYNKFPYDVASDIAHLVVWINPIYDADETEIRDRLSSIDIVLFENMPGHRSIKDVRHYQLFIKKEDIDKLTVYDDL